MVAQVMEADAVSAAPVLEWVQSGAELAVEWERWDTDPSVLATAAWVDMDSAASVMEWEQDSVHMVPVLEWEEPTESAPASDMAMEVLVLEVALSERRQLTAAQSESNKNRKHSLTNVISESEP